MKRYTKAVSATLASALAVGMVPAMALADEATPEVVADDGVELLVAGDTEDFLAGNITEVTVDGDKAGLDELDFVLGAGPEYPVPSVITTQSGVKVKYDNTKHTAEYWVVDKAAGTVQPWSAGNKVTKITTSITDDSFVKGTYFVTVVDVTTATAAGKDAPALKFTVAPASLDAAYLYEVNGGAVVPKADKEFVYTGSEIELALTFGPEAKTDVTAGEYTVDFYYQDPVTKKYDAADWDTDGDSIDDLTNAVLNAGNYVAWIKASTGNYAGYDKQVQFTVDALDLTSAEITFGSTPEYGQTAAETLGGVLGTLVAKVDGVEVAKLANDITVAHTGLVDSTPLALGVNKFTISPKVDALGKASVNVKGAQTLEVVRYLEPADFYYGVTAVTGTYDVLDPKTSQPTVIDPSKIAVVDGDDNPVAYTVVYEKQDANIPTKWEEVSNFTAPGNYRAVVTVDDATYAIGGKAVYNFYVKGNVVDGDKQIFVSHWNKFVDSSTTDYYEVAYDGTNVVEDFEFTVYDEAGKKLTEGADYSLKVTAGGKEVEGAVDAGKYVVEVVAADGTIFNISNNKFYIEVEKAEVYPEIAGQKFLDGVAGVPYTGEEITPEIEYFVENNPATALDDAMVALPADAYEIVKIEYNNPKTMKVEEVDALLEVGEYEVTIKLTEAGAKNYDLLNDVIAVEVINKTEFADVPAKAWYAEYAELADAMGLMNGYNGTDFFGPNDELIRGDAALIMFRLAGGAKFDTEAFWDALDAYYAGDPSDLLDAVIVLFRELNDNLAAPSQGTVGGTGYVTPFSDVNNEYYAQAVQWANKLGIMTGYKGTDKFGDEDALTREQLAAVICRFAEAAGYETAVEDEAAALAAYADGAKVSGYAEHCVAWCVENELMGVDTDYLKPGQDITRAEMAAMMVRFVEWMALN